MKKHNQKKQPSPFLIFLGLVFQMGVIIFCAAKLGKYIDLIYGFDRVFTAIITLSGVLISFYILIKQLKKINQ
ncbi:MAG: hypothetical protein ABR90_03830 [Cryomorphaceae bacterium BACL29 MAG-121220-bin8]|jgi:hypothetical protein|nr:MAG: hypothetical protein ABR90_03830 [Cryomorphaceae bacterium BACL29 MAG-121220-bin8]|tara:strand:+ start:13086 stop:13304 length:219 start_codon:yes stop_codon:yes gene_type:complete